MTLSFTLPLLEQKPTTTKDMVFTILTSTYPLSLVELQNTIHKQYARSLSFQSVRKAVLELAEAKVLVKEGRRFSISREWILEIIKFSNQLQKQYFTRASSKEKLHVGPNIVVYTIHSLMELDTLSNNIIKDNFEGNADQPLIVAAETMHFWFVIANLASETEMARTMIGSGVKVYYLNYGGTPLDRWTVEHYKSLGVKSKMLPKPKDFPETLNIGAFGDMVLKASYSPQVARMLNLFYKKYKTVQEAKLSEMIDATIFSSPIQITVMKDPVMAKSIRAGIISKF
jgi:hypothetical protein